MRPATATGKIWRWPLTLGLLSLAGLVAALIGDGWWDSVSWVSLGIVLLVPLAYSLRPATRVSRRR